MRKLLNTLYITTPESYLSKDGMNVVVSINQQEVFRIPVINLESIVTFGYKGASPGLMKLCMDNNVSLTFLSPNGRFVRRFQGPTRGNVLLRKAQYRLSEDEAWSLHVAKVMIGGKIQNYRNILRLATFFCLKCKFGKDEGLIGFDVRTALKRKCPAVALNTYERCICRLRKSHLFNSGQIYINADDTVFACFGYECIRKAVCLITV